MTKVIDISCWNTITDWAAIKAAGITGVIIRAGFGRVASQKDKSFDKHYAGAKAAGLQIGAYWYSYAQTADVAKIEAEVFIGVIKDKRFELPVYYDIEEAAQVKLGKTICTQMANAFCGTMEQAGYYCGVYSFDGFFATNLPADVGKRYTAWVARVESVTPTYCKKYDMWQYSWLAQIKGSVGSTDISNCYKDFYSIIKSAGLNGYSSAPPKYTVTARIAGLNKVQAADIADKCKNNAMTVVIAEED